MDDPKLTPLTEVLERVDTRLTTPEQDVRLWPTGFDLLDSAIGGGLRAGTLNLLAGPQGQGKTTMALQMCRNAVAAGRSALFFSFEIEAESLLLKLVSMEAGLSGPPNAATLLQIRRAFEGSDGVEGGLVERMQPLPGGVNALIAVNSYADRLVVHRSTSGATDLQVIATAVKDVVARCGEPPLIIVDYLQKVKHGAGATEEARITHVTEGLKDLAIEFDAPVLAIAASDKEGLEPGARMRARNLRGSTSLAYEADIVLIIATKADIVSRDHLMFDPTALERYKHWTVLTVEKNRSGRSGAEMEFLKRFDQGRFDPVGQEISEHLVNERLQTA